MWEINVFLLLYVCFAADLPPPAPKPKYISFVENYTSISLLFTAVGYFELEYSF